MGSSLAGPPFSRDWWEQTGLGMSALVRAGESEKEKAKLTAHSVSCCLEDFWTVIKNTEYHPSYPLKLPKQLHLKELKINNTYRAVRENCGIL